MKTVKSNDGKTYNVNAIPTGILNCLIDNKSGKRHILYCDENGHYVKFGPVLGHLDKFYLNNQNQTTLDKVTLHLN